MTPSPATFTVRDETVAVIDFETTGMSPEQGARPTEIAAVLVRGGEIVGRYQSLMNAGAWVPPFIEQLTGITNAMVEAAPPVDRVMDEVAGFVGACPLVAHNAAFDSRFWNAELARIHRPPAAPFACTLLLARRVWPQAPGHRLGTLARHVGVRATGRAHRALADAEMAAGLLVQLCRVLDERFGLPAPTHEELRVLQRVPKARLEAASRALRAPAP